MNLLSKNSVKNDSLIERLLPQLFITFLESIASIGKIVVEVVGLVNCQLGGKNVAQNKKRNEVQIKPWWNIHVET